MPHTDATALPCGTRAPVVAALLNNYLRLPGCLPSEGCVDHVVVVKKKNTLWLIMAAMHDGLK